MKAQILSLDLMIAIIILLFIFSTLSFIVYEYINLENERAVNRDMELKAQSTMSSLIETSGTPSNWENQTYT